jgi:uncharacterized protein (DUF1697 family)
MTTYVAMLRGINVSGRNALSMEDLRALLVAAGAKDVRTYIQSGNAVFTSRRSPATLVDTLENDLERVLGNKVPVLVRTIEELEAVIDANPFVARGEDLKVLHVTFLGEVPTAGALESVSGRRPDADEFQVIGRQVYLFCPNGYGNTKLTNAFFEKKLGSRATTRNWKTVTTLVQLAQG